MSPDKSRLAWLRRRSASEGEGRVWRAARLLLCSFEPCLEDPLRSGLPRCGFRVVMGWAKYRLRL
jgi:hypothetical protein